MLNLCPVYLLNFLSKLSHWLGKNVKFMMFGLLKKMHLWVKIWSPHIFTCALRGKTLPRFLSTLPGRGKSPQVAIFEKFPLNSSWHKLGWFFLGRYIFILHFLAFAIRKFNLDFSSIIKATFDKIPDSCFKLQFRENKYVKKSSIFRFC